MRILVSGPTGFIGRSLCDHFRSSLHTVFPLLRQPSPSEDAGNNVVWDLSEQDRPAGLPDQLDAIIHAAQSRNYRSFPGDANEMFRINTMSTISLLNYAADAGVKHFCLLSSGTVYEPYISPLREDAVVNPTGFLGASKLAAEIVAFPYSALFNLSVLRLFFPYGPQQRDRLIPNLYQRVVSGAPIQVGMDGKGLRFSPTYISDVVSSIYRTIVENETGTFNMASPETVTIADVAQEIGLLVGKEPILEKKAQVIDAIVPDLARFQSRFGSGDFVPFRQGLERTVRSFQT